MEYYARRCEDEPPDQIQNIKGNDNSNRGIKHTMGDIYRLLGLARDGTPPVW